MTEEREDIYQGAWLMNGDEPVSPTFTLPPGPKDEHRLDSLIEHHLLTPEGRLKTFVLLAAACVLIAQFGPRAKT